jgi:anaerobic magnesium-protoporphyrin IX monomethyl ester cyclase
MKVALVFPRFRYPSGDPPLGILYLAAQLRKKAGIEPVILDTTFKRNPLSFLEAELKRIRPDIIGISAMMTMARDALEFARMAKAILPESKVIMGGPHATVLPLRVLAAECVDAICAGEGEESFCEMVQKGSFEGVPGFCYSDDSAEEPGGREIVCNPERAFIPDLDKLPFPAFDLIDMEKYFQNWFQLDTVAPGLRGTSVLATRGCPFRCSYCQPTLDRIFGKTLRKRSPLHVCEELGWLVERFKLNAFLFADDTFIVDRAWVIGFCEEVLKRDLRLFWGCNVRADLVDEDMLARMKQAGLRKIYIGIEAYSDRIREEIYNKKISRDQIEAAVRGSRKLGLGIQGYFMLGAPGETRHEVLQTLRWARTLALDDATFNLTTPLPGTYLYEQYESEVALEPEDMDYYRRYAFRERAGMSSAQLNRMRLRAYLGFYLRPSRLLHLMNLLIGPQGLRRTLLKLKRVL